MSAAKLKRKFLVRRTGGRLGWSRFWIEANRVGHHGMDFTSVSFDDGTYGERTFSMSVEQAERVLELLPDAIKFAKGQKASNYKQEGK